MARLNTAKNKSRSEVRELVYQKIQKEVGQELSRNSAMKIFDYAYEDRHAYGIREVCWELERLIELVTEILDGQKPTRRKK